ncbi:MAG: DUF59 domain-containing protein [Opitutae bacterium]|nr:DUF59 domain-containing protein [Opitutae bacterium]
MASYSLVREIPAVAIPSGTADVLPAGLSVSIVQDFGGQMTVRTDRGLFRIERAQADALGGFQPKEDPMAPVGEFSESAVWAALRTCFDPEIPVNIVDLGLVYDLSIEKTADHAHAVAVKMTLTAPGCGMGPVIAEDVRRCVARLPAVASVQVHIVWDPVWTPQMISDEGRKILGLE